ncbi:flagellar hook-length control protein FliK [Rhodobacteraceae bacterium F11138]|nr:flagellar hook-length control protein FliK [Rhodobacteraceae bacterium F11138]
MIYLELLGFSEHGADPVKINVTDFNNSAPNAIEIRGNMHINFMPSPTSGDLQAKAAGATSTKGESARDRTSFGELFTQASDRDETADSQAQIELDAQVSENADDVEGPEPAADQDADDSELAMLEPSVEGGEAGSPEDAPETERPAKINPEHGANSDKKPSAEDSVAAHQLRQGSNSESVQLAAIMKSAGAEAIAGTSRAGTLETDIPKPAGQANDHQNAALVRQQTSGHGANTPSMVSVQAGTSAAPVVAPGKADANFEKLTGASGASENQDHQPQKLSGENVTQHMNDSVDIARLAGSANSPALEIDAGLEFGTSTREAPSAIGRAEAAFTTSGAANTELGLHRADSVRNAAAQAVEVFVRQPGKPVEISLNPQELGKVRMALSTTEAGVTVVILSERPETLDLMRRHIDQLAQEFQSLGYENTNFQFGDTESDADPRDGEGSTYVVADQSAADDSVPAPIPRSVVTGLDLRL